MEPSTELADCAAVANASHTVGTSGRDVGASDLLRAIAWLERMRDRPARLLLHRDTIAKLQVWQWGERVTETLARGYGFEVVESPHVETCNGGADYCGGFIGHAGTAIGVVSRRGR